MQTTVRPLAAYLAEMTTDPRHAKGLRHPLVAILCLCCVALMSGARTPKAIALWWKNRQDHSRLLPRLGFTKPYGPSPATLYRVLSLIPCAVLMQYLNHWAEENLADLPLKTGELEAVAIDGKTLRGSRRQGADQTHLLSALSQRLGLTLGQVAVDDKTNEIGALPNLWVDLVMEGRVFTLDALHTHTATARTIVAAHADYVLIVKDNQPTLRADLSTLFEGAETPAFVEDRVVVTEKGHGRLETRALQTSTALNDYLAWPGLQQVFRLDRQVVQLKTGEVRRETVYGLTSLSPQRANADRLLQVNRGHWSIENRSHWVRDVTFDEDRSQVREGDLPQVMAALRTCVISLLRLCQFRFIPDAFDFFASHPFEALAAIGC